MIFVKKDIEISRLELCEFLAHHFGEYFPMSYETYWLQRNDEFLLDVLERIDYCYISSFFKESS